MPNIITCYYQLITFNKAIINNNINEIMVVNNDNINETVLAVINELLLIK